MEGWKREGGKIGRADCLKMDLRDWRCREGRMEDGKMGRGKGGLSEAGFAGLEIQGRKNGRWEDWKGEGWIV